MEVIFITYDFLNMINNTISGLDKTIHDKMKDTCIDNFIHELQDYFTKLQSSTLLASLNRYTILTCAEIDKNFATCFDYNEKKIYYVPTKNIEGNMPVPGDALKMYQNGNFYVDYTAIFTGPDILKSSFAECEIAK